MKPILFVLLLASALSASAQRTYPKFAAGIAGGSTHFWGDLPVVDIKKHVALTGQFFLTPFIPIGIEVQRGTLVGSEKVQPFRKFQNEYYAWVIDGQVHLGEFLRRNRTDYNSRREFLSNVFKGGFLGTGIGIIRNHQLNTYRDRDDASTLGFDKVTEMLFPLNIGWDTSGFETRWITGIKGQVHFIQGDNMDGYYVRGTRNDAYGTIAVTVRYRFGPEGRSRF
jgi:hypothetical protein